MSTNIAIKEPIGNEIRKEDSEIQSQNTDFQKSLHLIAKSIRFGWQREFYHAVAFYNIKTFDQCRSEGKTFQDFLEELNVSATSGKRYVRIGRRLTETVFGEGNESALLTEELLEKLCSGIWVKDKITLRGLDKASRNLLLFGQYLRGEISDHELQTPQKDVCSEPVKNLNTAKTPIIEAKTAKPERVAIELWNRIEEKLSQIPNLLFQDIERYGGEFTAIYHEASEELRKEVGEKFREVDKTLSKVKAMLSALHRCNIGDVKAIFNDNEL